MKTISKGEKTTQLDLITSRFNVW